MRRNIALTVLALIGSLAAWTAVPIDTTGTEMRGWWTSLAVRGDTVHVGYAAFTNSNPLQTDIRYARSTDLGATWTWERVDSAANYGSGYALLGWWRGGLDIDTLGRPQIAYTVEASVGSFCTRAVRLGAGTWRLDTVEMRTSQPLVCHDADLKIDRNGRTHVVYSYYGFQTRYAIEDSAGWTIRDLNYGQSYGVGLALDSLANPHVVVGTLSDVRYGYSSDGGQNWLTEVVGSGWWHSDIALGPQDRPVVSFSQLNGTAWFGRRDGASNWYTTMVASGASNRPSVFCYGPDNSLHLACYAAPDLVHSASTDNGASWTPTQIANVGDIGNSCAVPDYVETRRGRFVAGLYPNGKLGVYCELSTGIADDPAAVLPALRVYPSPARGRAWVEQAAGSVSVSDVAGRVVLKAEAQSGRTEINLAGIEPGVYLVNAPGSAPGKLVVGR